MAENRCPDGENAKRRNNRKVHIFTLVTAKIEPALLKRVERSRLHHVARDADVEIVRDGADFAFQGAWKAVARAQSALKMMYVKSVTNAIEDRLTDRSHDDDKVSLRTSRCGSALSGSSNHSRSKIYIGNLTERVNMSLERSSSRHSQYLSDDSSKRHPDSDKEHNTLKQRNRNEEQKASKKTSLFSNLIHHKKSYIYKCAAMAQAHKNEQENGGETSKLQQLMNDLPELQTETPFETEMDTTPPTPCAESRTPEPPIVITKPEPVSSPGSSNHCQQLSEPRFVPVTYAPVPEPTYTNPMVFARPEHFPPEVRFPVAGPSLTMVAPMSICSDPPVDSYSPRPQAIPYQHPGYPFDALPHDAFFQNRGLVPAVGAFGLPTFPDLSAQELPAAMPAQWEVHVPEPVVPKPNPYMIPQSPPEDYKRDLSELVTQSRHRLLYDEKHAHSSRMHKCHLCEKTFSLKADLALHIRSHNTKHRCDQCGKIYKSSRLLTQHQLTHEGSYVKPTFVCPDCGKSFSTKYVLQNHVDNVHNGKQPAFVCSVCDKRFTQKHSLTEHQNIHLGLKPFKCETCQKSFSFRTSLSQHMLLHSAERQYTCNVCGKSFLQKNSLRLHSAIHSDNRAHCCSYCGKGFTQKQAMLRHERIHNGEKPYSCEVCGRAFNDSSILRRHMHVHSKNQPITIKHEIVRPLAQYATPSLSPMPQMVM